MEGHKLKWSLNIIYLCTEPLKSSSSHNLKMSRDQYNKTIRLQSVDVRKHMLCLSYTLLNNHAQLSFVPRVTQAYNKSSSKLKPLISGYFQGIVNLLPPSQQLSARILKNAIIPALISKKLLHLQSLPLTFTNSLHLLLKQFLNITDAFKLKTTHNAICSSHLFLLQFSVSHPDFPLLHLRTNLQSSACWILNRFSRTFQTLSCLCSSISSFTLSFFHLTGIYIASPQVFSCSAYMLN